jgi:asparagine synthase (glutamine-hydrolysing)
MCGIFGIVKKDTSIRIPLLQSTQIIKHRGPDDSGYMLWSEKEGIKIFADQDTSEQSKSLHKLKNLIGEETFKIAFGHRRLSILDLSPQGHQPMIFKDLVISFNGEVYNYLEIREQLIALGRTFHSQSDTEVILQAWDEWGQDALKKFNGMFALLIFDQKKQKLFAIRDRFGVKPLYYFPSKDFLAFGSEVKQLRLLPGYEFQLNKKIAYQYLRYGFLDHDDETFEKQIFQLKPGHLGIFDLNSHELEIQEWYKLVPKKFNGDYAGAQKEFKSLLKSATELRLRSDVPVGSALSGGLDSSAVVCLMDQILKDNHQTNIKLQTVTSSSQMERFDETRYAQKIIDKVGAIKHQVFPNFNQLKTDLESLIWHMDYPFGSTSQFAQWKVFQEAKKAGLIVMIDGQGADEQLAGYGGNDLFLYSGLLKKGRFGRILKEAKSYKQKNGLYPKGFLLGALVNLLPSSVKNLLPQKYHFEYGPKQDWLNHKMVADYEWNASSLQENLMNQVSVAPLPALLRYEDRNSMAFSVESRTPFMDYRLMEFSMGLPEEYVYKDGERKTILRSSMRGLVPDEILDRKDKMGFVSEEEYWIKNEGFNWFQDLIKKPLPKPYDEFFNEEELQSYVSKLQLSKIDYEYDAWRVVNFKIWLEQMIQGQKNQTQKLSF